MHAGEGLPRLQLVRVLCACGWSVVPSAHMAEVLGRGSHSHLLVRGTTNKSGREQGPRAPSGVTQPWMLLGGALRLSRQDWSLLYCDAGHSIRCEF